MTPETSLGFEVIEFADWIRDKLEQIAELNDEPEILELLPRLLEWQRWLLIHALELMPGTDLIFRFRVVLLLVARQNGKTTLLVYLILWRLFQDGARQVLGTAQSLEVAEEAWQRAVDVAEAIPELADEIAKVRSGKSSQLFQLDGGEKYKIAAANRRGGRGLTGDLVIFDELREHQSWAAWSATSKTTMARSRAQVWGVSNAGDMSSIVLKHLHTAALAQDKGETPPGVPDDVDLEGAEIFLAEWSADESRGIWDRDGWAEANPSLGYTITEAAIASAAGTDPEWVFRTEVLCQFVNMAGAGPFPNGSWAATSVEKVKRDTDRPACYGLAMSHDRTWVHVALAFWDTKGRMRVEIVASRPGPDWLIPWMTSPKRKVAPDFVAMQTRGAPITSMLEAIEKAGIDVAPWEGRDLAGWHGTFYDLVRSAVADDRDEGAPLQLTHGVQPNLDVAATSAVIKAIGDGWVLDLKSSPDDAAPLQAAIAAIGLLSTNPEPPMVSVYENAGLMVLD